jgi:hypothetical protein
MNKYQNGKIYKLTNDINDNVYIGSTIQSLKKRLSQHKDKNYKGHSKKLGDGEYYITLIKNYPCENKLELLQEERRIIETTNCINIDIPSRTEKEWRTDNKNHLKNYYSDWKNKNKDKLKYRTEKIQCPNCNKFTIYNHLARHKKSKKCIENIS